MNERPIDVLDKAKGKKVFIRLRNDEEVTGLLKALDLHLNMWLENVEIQSKDNKKKMNIILLRGSNILYASPT